VKGYPVQNELTVLCEACEEWFPITRWSFNHLFALQDTYYSEMLDMEVSQSDEVNEFWLMECPYCDRYYYYEGDWANDVTNDDIILSLSRSDGVLFSTSVWQCSECENTYRDKEQSDDCCL
jgi:hypothetical protein